MDRSSRPTPSTPTDPLAELLSAGRRQPIDPDDDRPMILFLCTGNAARSVMAGAMMRAALGGDPAFVISSGGTHVLPGQPMSVRTRRALERHGLTDPWHRSHQVNADDIARSSLIVAMEPMHGAWMQRTHPEGVAITGSLPGLVRELQANPAPPDDHPVGRTVFDARVTSLGLAGRPFGDWEEIIDPASGEQADFDACSDVIDRLVREFHAALL